MELTLGEKLQDLRKIKGKTTKQVAKETGISDGVLNGLENDSGKDVGYKKIIALANYYKVPTDYLLGLTESAVRENIDINKKLGLSDESICILERINQKIIANNQPISKMDLINMLIKYDFLEELCDKIILFITEYINLQKCINNDIKYKNQIKISKIIDCDVFDELCKEVETQKRNVHFCKFEISELVSTHLNRLIKYEFSDKEIDKYGHDNGEEE